MNRSIPLTDLRDVELRSTKLEERSVPSLWFTCPLCEQDHKHVIHHLRAPPAGGKLAGVLIWQRSGENTLEHLTLSPSYVAKHRTPAGECRLHVFVKKGQLIILGDSHGPQGG